MVTKIAWQATPCLTMLTDIGRFMAAWAGRVGFMGI